MEDYKVVIIFLISFYIYDTFIKEKVEDFCIFGVGDCGVKQTVVADIVNKAITNVVQTNAQSCGASTGIDQMIKISDLASGGDINISGINQTSNLKFNFSCLQSAENKASITKDIANGVKNDLNQATSGYQFSPTETSTLNSAITELTNNISNSNVSDCFVKNFSNQTQLIQKLNAKGNINISNIAQTAIQDVSVTCTQNDSNVTTSMEKVQSILDTKSTQKATGVDIFASITSLSTVWIVAIVGVILLSSVSIASVFGFSQSESGQKTVSKLTDAAISRFPTKS